MSSVFCQYAQNSPHALAALDSGHRVQFRNKAFNRLFQELPVGGATPTISQLISAEPLRSQLEKRIKAACDSGEEEVFTSDLLLDDEQKNLECRLVPCNGSAEFAILVEFRDQTEIIRLRNELINGRLTRRQEEYLKERRRRLFFGLLDDLPNFVYMQRRDYTVAYANNKVRELYGESEGRLCYEVFAGRSKPCPVCPTFEVFETGRPVDWEFTDNDGRTFLIYDYPFEDDTGEPLVMELGVDITELKQVEKELFEAQKLRAIGVLAGGIAHDINNNLVPIIFNTEYALNKSDDPAITEPLADALQGAQRAANLVEQVLEYSRQQDVTRSSFHLGQLLKESIDDLTTSLPAQITLNYEPRASFDLVSANAAQMRQLLINLIRNAEQAMPDGGTITVTLINSEFSADSSRRYRKLTPGTYLTLSVSDTGVGIRPEQQEQIFEPFFTSRKSSGGTGMGLAVVHSIVTGNDGTILVDSTPAIGTVFTVHLPLAQTSEERLQGEYCLLNGRNNGVLLVDDDPGALSAMARALVDAGFAVDTATSGHEGLELFSRNTEQYSLVLADQSMPGMTGLQMSIRMLELNRDARIVICTGHIEPSLEEQARKAGVVGFARKPASPKMLIEVVQRHCRIH